MDRKQQIVELLRVKNDWMTGAEIAQLTQVTSRTIRQDMKQLREKYGTQFLLVSKKKGYRLLDDECELPSVIEQQYTRKLRLLSLWKQLFFEDKVAIYEIADQFFVSESTILNDITYIRAQLDSFQQHSYSIQRNGEYCELKLANSEAKSPRTFYDFALKRLQIERLDEFASVFDEFCLNSLYRCCVEVLYRFEMSYQYISFIALAVEFATLITQSESEIDEEHEMHGVCLESIGALQVQVKQEMQIELTQNQCRKMYETLLNTQAMAEYESELRLSGAIPPQFAEKILFVFMQYHVPLLIYAQDQTEILQQFLCHLQLAREKQRRGFYTVNPLLNQLQQEHVMLFEIARRALRSIGLEFDENECSYVVIYLQLLFDGYVQRQATKLDVKLIVPNSYSNGLYVQKLVQQHMQSGDTCSVIRDVGKQKPSGDIIFSTNNLARQYEQTVMLSKQLNPAQDLKIQVTLAQHRQMKCQAYFQERQQNWEKIAHLIAEQSQQKLTKCIEQDRELMFQQAVLFQYCLEALEAKGVLVKAQQDMKQIEMMCEAYIRMTKQGVFLTHE